jgi:hypothetical protein
MKTIEDIRAKCDIVPHDRNPNKEHWIWTGAKNKDGQPMAWAPDFTLDRTGKTMRVQSATRAVRHITTGKPIRNGYGVFCTCTVPDCISPDCIANMTRKSWGNFVARTGREAGKLKWTHSNLRGWDKRGRVLSKTQAQEIMLSTKGVVDLAAEYGVSQASVSRVRRGISHKNAGMGVFSGLLR